jgi:phospholipase/carboxylesterase
MTFCLDATIIKPKKEIQIKNAIILLHGYGGDGKDISMVAYNWKRHLPNTIFICPNGHEKCSINPSGYQWFDLTKDDAEYISDQSQKAEKKLNQFLEEIKNEYKLENDKICLSGFSQGCMMSINLGLTSNKNFNCIVGFSGKIINQDDLKNRKKNSTDTMLIHGDCFFNIFT